MEPSSGFPILRGQRTEEATTQGDQERDLQLASTGEGDREGMVTQKPAGCGVIAKEGNISRRELGSHTNLGWRRRKMRTEKCLSAWGTPATLTRALSVTCWGQELLQLAGEKVCI